MKTPHKHAALIKQWADGAEIEYRDENHRWNRVSMPLWDYDTIYRVKPEPKPDVVWYCCLDIDCINNVTVRLNYFNESATKCDNLMLVFDGETRELKDAQVLAQE